ncbi:MFS transporter [Trinickia acidisoli]|uniref:MFS transporter n=1 Tax=Trinickia acidisoli TaxID=2767482 RepID=UPI001A8C745E|nr:MFS transporter [Trinickia acidisoli]
MEFSQSTNISWVRSEPAVSYRKLIAAASLGTVLEWYDFFIYALLASIIARQFFSGLDETSAYIVTLLSFAAGTLIRPLGALFFGRYGDRFGRKRTFIVTITLMGVATFCIGLLPSYATWGARATWLLIGLRLVQGFALGGEYGSAATYLAEHAPEKRRGFYTSWIQITTPLGQIFASIVIFLIQLSVGGKDFNAWGWRVPFALSILLLVISLWIRLSAYESPMFSHLQKSNAVSKTPIKDMLLDRENRRALVLALFGLTAGQAVVINVGMTYSFFFLAQTLKVNLQTANVLVGIALAVTAPLFVVFGALSDRLNRKYLILVGLAAAVLTYRPIFQQLTHYANPALETAWRDAPVRVVADPQDCSFQFNPTGVAHFKSSCDVAKSFLSRRGTPYVNVDAPHGTIAHIEINGHSVQSFDGSALSSRQFAQRAAPINAAFDKLVTDAGYPLKADPKRIDAPKVIALLALLMAFAALVYGPMAALLVEMFPTRVRLTSVSTAYNIGNGWFGGFTSPIAFALIAATGDIYAGLWYCIGVTLLTLVVSALFLKPVPRAIA